jgi:bacillithiol system protein YtxJ
MNIWKLLRENLLFRDDKSQTNKMNWNHLNAEDQLEAIKEESKERPVLIFKHSTSCSISAASLSRMEKNWMEEESKNIKLYYLDILNNRGLSNAVAKTFQVEHQSPQVVLIKNGESVYDESHFGISFQDIVSAV